MILDHKRTIIKKTWCYATNQRFFSADKLKAFFKNIYSTGISDF